MCSLFISKIMYGSYPWLRDYLVTVAYPRERLTFTTLNRAENWYSTLNIHRLTMNELTVSNTMIDNTKCSLSRLCAGVFCRHMHNVRYFNMKSIEGFEKLEMRSADGPWP